MARTWLTSIDLAKNELQNATLQNLASPPSSPIVGQFYYDTTQQAIGWWTGAAWVYAGTSQGANPIGSAGGDLTGSYPNPTLRTSLNDPSAATPGLRTLGTGALQATAGNDPRLSDTRVPTDGSVTAAKIALGGLPTSSIANFDTAVRASRLDQMAVPTSGLNLNGQLLTNVATPVSPNDASTKAYVDNMAQGINAKASVHLATTANITLSGLQTIDGVALVAGDRVLVKNQTTASANGIYVAGSGAWTRATDNDTATEMVSAFVFVEEGTANADSGWLQTANSPITLGTTNINWVQFSGAGQITAGNGLTKTGNTLAVSGTANRITVGTNVDIHPSYVGQASITTLGTVTTGTWNGATIAVANGGTGATTAAAARANLGVPGKYAQALTGGATSEVVTHNLGTRDVAVSIAQSIAPYAVVEADVELTTTNTVTVRTAQAIPASTYRITIVG